MIRWGASIILAALVMSSAPKAYAEEATLKVLTYNIWGIPIITPSRSARVDAIGEAIAEIDPDLVTLQEVWLEEDAEALRAALQRIGLVHTWTSGAPWPANSGLLIASRYPIREARFAPYSRGSVPHTPWHLDWIAGKGAARVRIETPAGDVDFAATHLQSGYGSDEYMPVQVSQMLEAADLIRRDATALIVAGDLNADWRAIPFRVLATRAGLSPTDEQCGIDCVLVRSGGHVRIETLEVEKVFQDEVVIDGEPMKRSDHPGILAKLRLTPSETPVVADVPHGAAAWKTVAAETVPILRLRLSAAKSNLEYWRTLGACLLLGTLILTGTSRRVRCTRSRSAMTFVGLTLAAVAAWYLYLGLAYGPDEVETLQAVHATLSKHV